MNRNKHLLLWSSVGVFILLVMAAANENLGREWRQIQGTARSPEGAPEGAMDVHLRQVINPGLNISDRCVSCHVGMAPGEQGIIGDRVLAAHKAVVHQPAEFGCTVCHGGQGRATDKADAHGDVHFWPEPMIPIKYAYAGCGTCHTPLKVPNISTLEKARGAFERLDCLACHRVDGRGATIRPGGGGLEGPDLSSAGFRGFDTGWYETHLKKSEEAQNGPWKASFGAISEEDRGALTTYLSTRVGSSKLVEAKAAFNSSGCLGCHKVSGVGGDAGPDLSRAGEKDPGILDFTHVPGSRTFALWLGEHFRSPAAIVPGSQMPMMGLSENQIDLLTMYVLSLRRRELPGAYLPKDRVQVLRFGAREFSTDGATIFSAICSGCHGADGKGRRYAGSLTYPAIAGQDFLELASDEFITETISKGRPGRKMPVWASDSGLKPDEIVRVVAYLRQLGGDISFKPDSSPARWIKADKAAGSRLFTSNCSGCHGQKGEGAEGPALNNKVLLSNATDRFLVETIGRGRRGTAMQGFLNPSPTRSTLSTQEIESIIAFIRSWEAK
ncbi:MAG: c-type cytochrome [Acidobacteria bacterium]|nr:c-type cytochrome [Acidobacteriota bacterium]